MGNNVNKGRVESVVNIDARGLIYRELNVRLRDAVGNGTERIVLQNVCGQRYIGTGMHGGVMYLRGVVDDFQLGKEVGVAELGEDDYQILSKFVCEFAEHFGCDAAEILKGRFVKLFPLWLRPYGTLYAY
jgi:glutamate synthase domain-containing protein 3